MFNCCFSNIQTNEFSLDDRQLKSVLIKLCVDVDSFYEGVTVSGLFLYLKKFITVHYVNGYDSVGSFVRTLLFDYRILVLSHNCVMIDVVQLGIVCFEP